MIVIGLHLIKFENDNLRETIITLWLITSIGDQDGHHTSVIVIEESRGDILVISRSRNLNVFHVIQDEVVEILLEMFVRQIAMVIDFDICVILIDSIKSKLLFDLGQFLAFLVLLFDDLTLLSYNL